MLAEGGPDAATPNQIARRCGYTWGRVSHHFGDTDGTWAAVLDEVLERRQHFQTLQLPVAAPVRDSMEYLIERMWHSYDVPEIRAVQQVRRNVPKDRQRLKRDYPKTAAALLRWDADWETVWKAVFSGLGVSGDKIRHVRSLVPGALRGLHAQRELGTYTDVEVGRRCLTDALVLYLQS